MALLISNWVMEASTSSWIWAIFRCSLVTVSPYVFSGSEKKTSGVISTMLISVFASVAGCPSEPAVPAVYCPVIRMPHWLSSRPPLMSPRRVTSTT